MFTHFMTQARPRRASQRCPQQPSLRLRAGVALVGVVAVMTATLAAHVAVACGGCFSPPGPNLVVQDAERILYVRDAKTKKTTLTVEIRYSGPAETFAWVLPLPKQPKIGVSTGYVFDRLDQATAPRFTTTRTFRSEGCSFGESSGGCGDFASSTDSAGAAGFPQSSTNGGKDGGVVVLETSIAGSFETVTFKGDDGQKLLDWLNERGFATPASAKPILDVHAKKGDVFVAIKLVSGASIAEIRPITLEMDDADPCVPLRLTSIAAADELAVILYTVGPGRAVPKNMLHVQVNPLRLRWDGGVENYNQVLAAAIDEAAGRAFATEFAGLASDVRIVDALGQFGSDATALFSKTITNDANSGGQFVFGEDVIAGGQTGFSVWKAGLPYDKARFVLTGLDTAKTAAQVVAWLQSGRFAVVAEVATILEARTKLAAAAQRDDVLAFWIGVRAGAVTPSAGLSETVDGKALSDDLRVGIVEPIFNVADALAAGDTTLTRLQLRISAAEMDRDPIFGFNAALPAVDTNWAAEFNEVCSRDTSNPDSMRLHLVKGPLAGGSWILDGNSFDFNSNSQKQRSTFLLSATSFDARWKDAPAARAVELFDEVVPPVVIASSQISLVDTAIAGAQPGVPSLPVSLALNKASAWQAPDNDPDASLRHDADAAHPDDGCGQGSAGRRRSGALALMALALGAIVSMRLARKQRNG
jgi:hypothetical protein